MAQEVEFKFRVQDEAALTQIELAAKGAAEGTVHQVNHFFDSKDRRFNRAKAILRLRHQRDGDIDKYIVTAKGPGTTSADGTLTKKSEEEASVSAEVAAKILAGDADPLALLAASAMALPNAIAKEARVQLCDFLTDALGDDELTYLGKFKNARTRIRAPLEDANGAFVLLLELDHTVLPGDVDQYEVEVEVPGDEATIARAKTALSALLAEAKVEWESAPPKAKRFFAALDGTIL